MKNKNLLIALAAVSLFLNSAFAQARVWRIAVISDMNKDYGDKTYTPALAAAIKDIRAQQVSLVLSTGDMASGEKPGLDYPGMWEAFHNNATRPLSQSNIPLLPSPGNHDASVGAKFAVERKEYQKTWMNFPFDRYNMIRSPDEQIHFLPGVEQNYPLNYAFTMGPALFIAMDAVIPGGLINNQYAWIEKVLSLSAPYKIKILFGHFPLYPFTFQRAHETLAQGTVNSGFYAKFENLLEQNNVTYFLSGHHHAYFPGQRSGKVKYISVPLLGTGNRYLLTRDRSQKERSPTGFLYIDFDDQGNIDYQALMSPSLQPYDVSKLPEAISIPKASASDCTGCGSYPSVFFLNTSKRTVYNRF
jgi:hypothetical protein